MAEPGVGSEDIEGGKRKDFICGVVEGFYGRPWTTEQRKDLFQKMKKWGMDTYVYAPKDDYKHRAYWRELYTVEEAEHLSSLIAGARAQGVTFCYALSPGLDITYSSHKEMTALKRKLEQVSQFGCTSFALLFDDIDTEMSESDKQIFQSFAHAQVSVTNEVHQHLGRPQFIVCPTQYCAARASPDVVNSEYLNTLGTKLATDIHIMWTGPKVISKTLTAECIEEITQVLRRPPVIWDNLHANDYDQKRVFLGPYCGRSPELIPLLRGVLTNPNCEYNANMIAINTLANWAKCSSNAPVELEAVAWDIKLERESELGVAEDELTLSLDQSVYHHRQALRRAIDEWLPEFSISKSAGGPVIKPMPIVSAPVPIIPIMPSVNTCMSLATPTLNSPTTTSASVPTVNASQLQALAQACADRPLLSTSVQMETLNPVANPIMNSLVSPTKVVLNESLPNPITSMASSNMSIPELLPVSTLPVPMIGLKSLGTGGDEPVSADKEKFNGAHEDTIHSESVLETEREIEEEKRELDVPILTEEDCAKREQSVMSVGAESPVAMSPATASIKEGSLYLDVVMTDGCSENGSMQVEPSSSPVSSDMLIEPEGTTDETLAEPQCDPDAMSADDLVLLCDLFYLPFEHGSRGLRLLHDWHWLVTRAASILPATAHNTEVCEWRRRRCRFAWWCNRVRRLARRLARCANRELHTELQPYVWDLTAVLALLDGFARWLELGKFSSNIANYSQGTYTWFSKGWRDAFESGAQEPWVFRGGLTADLRRLIPVECGTAELMRAPAITGVPMSIRPYRFTDEEALRSLCLATSNDGDDASELFPSDLQSLPADRHLSPFLLFCPEMCLVSEDCEDEESGGRPLGYVCVALDCEQYYTRLEIAWTPEMKVKYPESLLSREDLSTEAKEYVRSVRAPAASPGGVASCHPGLLSARLSTECRDAQAAARLVTCALAAARAAGVTGVHAMLKAGDTKTLQMYNKLGFQTLHRDGDAVYVGRTF